MNQERLFVDAIETIYAVALSDERWESALSAISNLLGAVCVSFEVINKRLQCPVFLRMGGDYNGDMGQQYLQYYSRISPRVRVAEKYATGDISYDYQILSEQEIKHNEYYNDFALPQGQRYFVAGHVLNDSSHMALFAAQRSPRQGHVEKSEVELVERLLPHVQQALNLKFRIAGAELVPGAYLEHLNSLAEAVVGINALGKVVFANRLAEAIFAKKDGVDCQQGYLSFFDKLQLASFNRALQSMTHLEGERVNTGCREFVIKRSSNRSPYIAAMRPVTKYNEFAFLDETRAAALLFIRDPEEFTDLDTDSVQASFQLSPQELDLANALNTGVTLQDIARRRSVAITTVRTQLYSLMSKVGVNRQTDLIRCLGQYRRPLQ